MSYTLGTAPTTVTVTPQTEVVITTREKPTPMSPAAKGIWGVASVASAFAGAFHGYRRNKSIGWAIVWALMGGMFPVIVPAIALAQGFGKPKDVVVHATADF